MEEKRTKQLGIRISEETHQILKKEADKLKWKVPQLINEILVEWTTEAKEEKNSSINFIINKNGSINIGG